MIFPGLQLAFEQEETWAGRKYIYLGTMPLLHMKNPESQIFGKEAKTTARRRRVNNSNKLEEEHWTSFDTEIWSSYPCQETSGAG